MEVFIEYMVKKKKTVTDYLKVILLLFAGILAVFVLINFMFIQFIGTFALLAAVGVVYLLCRLVTSINVEYEYTLTNFDIDVDKIINAKRRKRVTTLNLKSTEAFGNKKSPEFDRYYNLPNIKRIFACRDFSDDGTCFAVYKEGEQSCILLFDPNEKIAERIKAINPQKTFLA